MLKKKLTIRRGFTLIELIVTMVIGFIVIFGIGVVLVDNQRGWYVMYNRVYSDVVTDSYVARRVFDTEIRKASRERFLLDSAGSWIEVYYYADGSSIAVDRYARFYETDGQLNIEYGNWNPGDLEPREPVSTRTVCSNVSSCVFKGAGRSAQMILALDDGSQTVTVTSSAVMHNQ